MQAHQIVEMNEYTKPQLYDDEETETHHSSSIQISKERADVDDDLENDDFEDQQLYKFKPHYGNSWVCCFFKGEPLITLGPHWPLTICMIASFGMASYFLITFIAPRKNQFLYYASWVIAFLQMLSYMLTAFKNPGIVTGKKPIKDNNMLQCLVCRVPRSAGALYHCDDCDVCVKGYDHHCPWTGKCIASGNLNFFYVFVIMIPVYFVFFMIVALV